MNLEDEILKLYHDFAILHYALTYVELERLEDTTSLSFCSDKLYTKFQKLIDRF